MHHMNNFTCRKHINEQEGAAQGQRRIPTNDSRAHSSASVLLMALPKGLQAAGDSRMIVAREAVSVQGAGGSMGCLCTWRHVCGTV